MEAAISSPISDARSTPCAIVLFGATGDLTRRKLAPALYSLFTQGLLPERFAIVAYARRPIDTTAFRESLHDAVQSFAPAVPVNRDAWDAFASRVHYQSGGLNDPLGYQSLAQTLGRLDRELDLGENRLYYLATPPEHFAPIVGHLGAAGLVEEPPGQHPWRRVVIEKPFGRDLETARKLNASIAAVLREHQTYRIDHYLGKETVQNILALRFANRLFELLWNHLYIDNVQITVAETLGVEGRGAYFDSAGILRDIVQNHALQILTLIAMEPPVSLAADAIRDEKVKVLRSLRLPMPSEFVWAQYGTGTLGTADVVAYTNEPAVPANSRTETYVAAKLHVDNWRWDGVPFCIRAGKRLSRRVTEVVMELKAAPDVLFSRLACSRMEPNRITIRIQPNEGVQILMGAKRPGAGMQIEPVRMRFTYESEFGIAIPDAYERLLLNAVAGDASLFARNDEVEAAWAIVSPALDAWADATDSPALYAPGSWGPAEADALMAQDGRRWWSPD